MSNIEQVGYGSLSKNERKEQPSHKDFNGKMVLNNDLPAGTYWLAGWTKTADDGRKWISLVMNPQVQQAQQYAPRPAAPQRQGFAQRPAPAPQGGYDDNDIPFGPEVR